MENLKFYEAGAEVPANAKKAITGGDLNGKTDINPMWRIKKLTEMFGPVGLGWKIAVERLWLEDKLGDEVIANAAITLQVKYNGIDGEWSDSIPGVGGNKALKKDKRGEVCNDEAYKMALTDAISVACKLIGIGANVYWEKDATKYTGGQETSNKPSNSPAEPREAREVQPDQRAERTRNAAQSGGQTERTQADEERPRKTRREVVETRLRRLGATDNTLAWAEKHYGVPLEQLTDEEVSQIVERLVMAQDARGAV